MRIASSVRALAEDPLEIPQRAWVGCAGLQVIITRCERGDFGGVWYDQSCLSPLLHAGSDAYPGVILIPSGRHFSEFISAGFISALFNIYEKNVGKNFTEIYIQIKKFHL